MSRAAARWMLGRLRVGEHRSRLDEQLVDGVLEAPALTRLEHQLGPGRAKRLVDADEHRAQASAR